MLAGVHVSRYAIHALLGVSNRRTDEATREAGSLDEALALIREVAEQVPGFRAVTLMHVEDLPLTLQGAESVVAQPEDGCAECTEGGTKNCTAGCRPAAADCGDSVWFSDQDDDAYPVRCSLPADHGGDHAGRVWWPNLAIVAEPVGGTEGATDA
jgi:hypothetical protein